MKKVYLAGGISDTDRKKGQREIARRLRKLDYDVYAAAENDSINDKSNNPTPLDIYKADVERILESDIFVVRISGAGEDGTLSEIGMVAGYNEACEETKNNLYNHRDNKDLDQYTLQEVEQKYHLPIPIVVYTTNERLLEPQFWNGVASAGFNHLIAGMIDKWGVFVGNENDMLAYMEGLYDE